MKGQCWKGEELGIEGLNEINGERSKHLQRIVEDFVKERTFQWTAFIPHV
jgi:hypothetical protein